MLQDRSDSRVLLNEGQGEFRQFVDVVEYDQADWNADGRLDLLVYARNKLGIHLLRDDGQYELVFERNYSSRRPIENEMGDFDQDGDLDFLLWSEATYWMANSGSGEFEAIEIDVSGVDLSRIESVEMRDFNGDGLRDIIARDYGRAQVLFGDPLDPFRHRMDIPFLWNMETLLEAPVDLDRDGYLDQVIAWEPGEPSTRIMVYWGGPLDNLRTPTDMVVPGLTVPAELREWGDRSVKIEARDIDQDGDYDLVLADSRVVYNEVDRLRPWGDVDGDGTIDVHDVHALSAAIRVQDVRRPLFDLNRDDRLDQFDLSYLVQELLSTGPGDANLDGRFDTSDMVLVFQAGEYEDEMRGNSTWDEGDWDGDGDFTTLDLVVAFQSGQYENQQGARRNDSLSAIAADVAQAVLWRSQADDPFDRWRTFRPLSRGGL